MCPGWEPPPTSQPPHCISHRGLSQGSGWLSSSSLAQGLILFVGHIPSAEVATLLATKGPGCSPIHPSIQLSTYPASIHPSTHRAHSPIHGFVCKSIYPGMFITQPSDNYSAFLSEHLFISTHQPSIQPSICTYSYLSLSLSIHYSSMQPPHPSAHLSIHFRICFLKPLHMLCPNKAHVLTDHVRHL